ncbi:MAG: hypothetical protein ACM357_01335 [Gemmatimonadota bacterium]
MTDEMMEPLEPDPELGRAWRAALGDTPTTDWLALEARVTEAARFRLRARRPAGWRTTAARWARVAIPAGLAASALLGAGLAWRASDEAVVLEDIVATAAVDALPSDLASLGGESLVYALLVEGE